MKQMLMIVMVGVVGLLVACGGNDSRRDATTVGQDGWVVEGWACEPKTDKNDPPSKTKCGEKKDYLYMKFAARASQKALDANSIAMKMSTCREAARLQVAGDGLAKIIGEYLEKASGVSDGQSTGVAIVSQMKGKISGIGIYDCCSIDQDTGKCVSAGKKEDWNDCMCVGYMKFPGGQKAFQAKAEEVKGGGN